MPVIHERNHQVGFVGWVEVKLEARSSRGSERQQARIASCRLCSDEASDVVQ